MDASAHLPSSSAQAALSALSAPLADAAARVATFTSVLRTLSEGCTHSGAFAPRRLPLALVVPLSLAPTSLSRDSDAALARLEWAVMEAMQREYGGPRAAWLPSATRGAEAELRQGTAAEELGQVRHALLLQLRTSSGHAPPR